jgi:hexosaminidase
MRLTVTLFIIVAFTAPLKAQLVNIIPRPVSIKQPKLAANFGLTSSTVIVLEGSNLQNASNFLTDYLQRFYQLKLKVVKNYPGSNAIRLNYERMDNAKGGAYRMTVDSKGVYISGDNETGVFYGVQTLIQLMPLQIPNTTYQIPYVSITDYPRFAYRGMHLDCGRHFFPVSFIKKYIDYIALHKMNYFHWHLTEDQGWRIEIKKYPRLTQVGAWRNGTIIGRYPGLGNDGIRYGGFYTQDEIRDVVAYAAKRYITVIPEIEMPGHSSAAIAAYPYLSCFPNESTKHPPQCAWSGDTTGKQVQQTWGVFEDVFCAGKDSTFQFLENVLDEVMSLFPSKYIHVGGDECPKTHWARCPFCQRRIKDEHLKDEHELQSYFVQRIEKYLNSKGRTLIGWDEILEGGLAPKAIVMSWRGEEGGVAAAKQKHNVIMTPGDWVYLNTSQTRNEDSVTIGGYLPLEKVYRYEPVPATLSQDQKKYVLGAQGNLWTEYIGNERIAEYMLFPRMTALSEVLWSQKKDSAGFVKRLMTQFKRYDLWNASYSRAFFDVNATILPTSDYHGVLWDVRTNLKTTPIQFYKTKLDTSKHGWTMYPPFEEFSRPVLVLDSSVIWASIPGRNIFRPEIIYFNKATGKKITLRSQPSRLYPGDGAFTLVNGVQNEKGLDRPREFLGFNGTDCEASIDLGTTQQINNVKAHVLEETSSWIWRPKYFQVLISPDDKIYTEMGMTDVIRFNETNTNGIMTVQQKSVAARYLRIKLGNYGIIPDGNPGAGNSAWLFVDEIEVNIPNP